MDSDERSFWDTAAVDYDALARHGIRTDAEKAAWSSLLARLTPSSSRVLEVGTGTGGIAEILSQLGHHVTAVDASIEMLAAARLRQQAADLPITFLEDDLNALTSVQDSSYDVVISRHVMWLLRDPVLTVKVWSRKCRSGGRVIAIDGCWHPSGGIARAKKGVGRTLLRLTRRSPGHGADFYDRLGRELPLRKIQSFDPVTDVFERAGLTDVRGEWIPSIDRVEKKNMHLTERLTELGSRYVVWGTKET